MHVATPDCASQMTAAAAAAAAVTAVTAATAAAASPTRYERTLRNCARDLSDFASCTEPGAASPTPAPRPPPAPPRAVPPPNDQVT